MAYKPAYFPSLCWTGWSSTRESMEIDSPPTSADWDRLMAEFIAVQQVVLRLIQQNSSLQARMPPTPAKNMLSLSQKTSVKVFRVKPATNILLIRQSTSAFKCFPRALSHILLLQQQVTVKKKKTGEGNAD